MQVPKAPPHVLATCLFEPAASGFGAMEVNGEEHGTRAAWVFGVVVAWGHVPYKPGHFSNGPQP